MSGRTSPKRRIYRVFINAAEGIKSKIVDFPPSRGGLFL